MRILAYKTQVNNSKVQLTESTGDKTVPTDSLDVLFSFLLEPQGNSDWQPQYDQCIRICWELDATIAPILKLLGKKLCIKLHQTHKCYCAPFNVFYVPDKIFSVTHIPSKARASLYNLVQYFPELDEPKQLIEVQMLGEKLLDELKKMGLEPTKLTSPVAIYEECVMQYLDLPKVSDMPQEAAEFAYRCSGRLWIEGYYLGHYESAYDYDLTSAFPSIAKDLIDIRHCDWVKSSEYQPSAIYGYVKCEVTIYDWVEISPILKEEEDGSLISPTGTWETYLTKGELDFIDRWKIGEHKIIEGWWVIPKTKQLSQPLTKPMDKLLAYKQRGGLQAALAKRMSTGIYGKMGEERKEEFGPYFNPCYFAEISTQVRLQVAEWLYEHDIGPGRSEHLLHISVDGALLDTKIKGFKRNKVPKSENGKWRLNSITPALIISSGLVFYADKKPKGLSYEDMLRMIKEHPRVAYYEKRLKRRVTLADALAQDKFEDLGEEVEMTSSIDLIRMRHDRIFDKLPESGRQLMNNHYQSKSYQATSYNKILGV